MSQRVRTAVGRGSAKADTWVAAVVIWVSGVLGANDEWVWCVVVGLVGLVFLVSAGDYCWRKGYVAAQREADS
jgi:hypothetical protein